jgi:phosphatidylglycerol---prolipoprotein diacylglyceryl transferase
MHFPIEFAIGSYKISAHLIFETLAFVIGFRYFLYLRKQKEDSIDESNRVWIMIGAIFGSFIFSRLIGALENPLKWMDSDNKLLYFYSNKTILGGLLGGLLCVELTKKWIGEKQSSGDLFTYPLILAMCIGRIGCFTSGIYEATYGVETTLFTGMDLGDGLMRHPVALYEIGFLICLFLLLKWLEIKYTFNSGLRFQLFMVAYLLFRFALDFIKPGYTFFWGIGTIQICCALGLVYYGCTKLKLRGQQ